MINKALFIELIKESAVSYQGSGQKLVYSDTHVKLGSLATVWNKTRN